MRLKLERTAVSLDVEATRVDPNLAAIFWFGSTLLRPDGTRQKWGMKFKPWEPIPPEVEELTGVTNADVENCPPFSDWAPRIHRALQGKDFIGFNLWRYDLPAIDAEMRRCGLKLDLADRLVIDAFGIFAKKETRTLSAAVQKYCGRSHEGAHGADVDADATVDVVLGQLDAYEDLAGLSIEELATFSRMSERPPVDLAGKLYRDTEGWLCFAFGKNENKRVLEQGGYVDWMARNNFPGSTMDCIQDEFDRADAGRKAAKGGKR